MHQFFSYTVLWVRHIDNILPAKSSVPNAQPTPLHSKSSLWTFMQAKNAMKVTKKVEMNALLLVLLEMSKITV